MNNKHNNIAVLTDLHIGCKSFNKQMFENQMNFFEQQFFPYILEKGIQDVLCLGDIAHNRNFVDLYILHEFKKRFCQWFDDNKINLYAIVGNHDTVYKSTIEYNFLRTNMSEYEYIHIIDEPITKNIGNYRIGFVPWKTDHTKIQLPNPKDVDFVAGHFEMADILMQGNVYSKHGMSVETFKDYKMVLSGHYHATSQKGNILYVGTQYQTNWGDYNNKKGFYVIKDKMQMDYIENVSSPIHYRLYYEEIDGVVNLTLGGKSDRIESSVKEVKNLIKNNYFKFIVTDYSDQVLLRKYFENLTENSYNRVDLINDTLHINDIDTNKLENEIEEDLEFIDIVKKFVSNSTFSQDIDKDVLLEKIESLVERSKEIEVL